MSKYMLTYIGSPKSMTPEEGQEHMAEYKSWMASLGEALLSPANPIKNTHVIAPDGAAKQGSVSAMSGFSILSADNYEDALALAKSCPFLKVGGSLELSEMIEMSM